MDFSTTGFHSSNYQEIQQKLDDALRGETQVVIVSRGRRFSQHRMDSSRATIHMGCEDLRDPNESGELRPHIGWRKAILRGPCGLSRFVEHVNSILEFIREHKNERILVDLTCKSGRHRSVGEGLTVLHCLKALGYEAELIHASSWKWTGMRCGGVCRDCNDLAGSLREIQHLIPRVQTVTIRARGSVASRSKADVRDAVHAPKTSPGSATKEATRVKRSWNFERSWMIWRKMSRICRVSRPSQAVDDPVGVQVARSRSPLRRRYKLPTPPRAPRKRSPSLRRKSPPGRRVARGRSPEIRSEDHLYDLNLPTILLLTVNPCLIETPPWRPKGQWDPVQFWATGLNLNDWWRRI